MQEQYVRLLEAHAKTHGHALVTITSVHLITSHLQHYVQAPLVHATSMPTVVDRHMNAHQIFTIQARFATQPKACIAANPIKEIVCGTSVLFPSFLQIYAKKSKVSALVRAESVLSS